MTSDIALAFGVADTAKKNYDAAVANKAVSASKIAAAKSEDDANQCNLDKATSDLQAARAAIDKQLDADYLPAQSFIVEDTTEQATAQPAATVPTEAPAAEPVAATAPTPKAPANAISPDPANVAASDAATPSASSPTGVTNTTVVATSATADVQTAASAAESVK